jgi:NTE family protein
MRLPRAGNDGGRVGLVLGAGGITGIAWLVGALEAIREHSGWDPASADVVSGTSAGAVAAAVLVSDVPPRSLLTYAEDPAALDEAAARATAGRRAERAGLPWPGSLALGLTGLLATSPRHRLASLAGFVPTGRRSGDEIRGLTHEAVAGGWPTSTELWLHACDYGTGERVTFGRGGHPAADLADAVAASCAVPGYYQPVTISGRRYIDGGVWSFSNADALRDAGCDTVICLTPFSTRARGSALDTALYGPLRRGTAAGVAREVDALRAAGARVAVIEPAAADVRAMGLNPMDRSRSREVLETAVESVGRRLGTLLADVTLPAPAPATRRERVAAALRLAA